MNIQNIFSGEAQSLKPAKYRVSSQETINKNTEIVASKKHWKPHRFMAQ